MNRDAAPDHPLRTIAMIAGLFALGWLAATTGACLLLADGLAVAPYSQPSPRSTP